MSKKKVLLIALAIILLGGFQVVRMKGTDGRSSRIAVASGMFILMSGIAVGIYGLGMKEKR